MRRPWILVQLLIGWLPVGVLFTLLVFTAHRSSPHEAIYVAARAVVAGVIVCTPLFGLAKRWPWPNRLTVGFFLRHVVAGASFSVAFVALNSLFESAMQRRLLITVGVGFGPFFVTGVWIYAMVIGVIYATNASARAARAEDLAARSQLAALRAQLNPHFLFNALHTVVHLIPQDPARASTAAEEIAALLRTTLENDRDLVPLDEELAFVRRYLSIERIRFGDRLCVDEQVDPRALDALVPVFSVQAVVENAIRHGAAPRIETTTIAIDAALVGSDRLRVSVRDDGAGFLPAAKPSTGSGLNRLRDQFAALYGSRASLTAGSNAPRGWVATFELPFEDGR